MKTSTPPTATAVKFNKVSSFETKAKAEVSQSINDKLEAVKVNLGAVLTAADFTYILRVAIEELNSLQPAEASPEARKAYLAAEAKRKATGKESLPYEAFLCYYGKHNAKKRYAMILSENIDEADVLLAQAVRTVEKLVKLDAALTQRTK